MRPLGLCFVILLLTPQSALAWGKRGHSVICQTAAYLASNESKGGFLKAHSFDLGYYCNVPDLVWKKGDLYQKEWFNHFMDLEIFERAFKETKVEKPYELDRHAFNEKFPGVENSAGRSFWRIRELLDGMTKIGDVLKKPNLEIKERHERQAEWLLHAGAIGHYIGDLAQPLHVTENYDGQLSEQKGVHAWFEDEVVNEIFLAQRPDLRSDLESDVMKAAEVKWKKNKGKWSKMSTLTLLEELTKQSNQRLKALLDLDRRIGRKDVKRAAKSFRPQIVEQMGDGAAMLAFFWQRELGWDYNGAKFYDFLTTPAFIEIPEKNVNTATP